MIKFVYMTIIVILILKCIVSEKLTDQGYSINEIAVKAKDSFRLKVTEEIKHLHYVVSYLETREYDSSFCSTFGDKHIHQGKNSYEFSFTLKTSNSTSTLIETRHTNGRIEGKYKLDYGDGLQRRVSYRNLKRNENKFKISLIITNEPDDVMQSSSLSLPVVYRVAPGISLD